MCSASVPAADVGRHPCLSASAARRARRVHLPVAPGCNVECNYCDRRTDCVNESRPGVTSALLSPVQALARLRQLATAHPDLSVVGIAGPGDPFATPEATLETLALVRREMGEELLLCVATNGLGLAEHVADLAALRVQFVTITINALDTRIGERIYRSVQHRGKRRTGAAGFELLCEAQMRAIRRLKAHGIHVKVNTVVIPGINAAHVPAVAAEMARNGVDTFNCVALHPVAGTPFGDYRSPTGAELRDLRRIVGDHLPVMHHCARCRADADGLLPTAAQLMIGDRFVPGPVPLPD